MSAMRQAVNKSAMPTLFFQRQQRAAQVAPHADGTCAGVDFFFKIDTDIYWWTEE